jgi:hypothetical protein
VHVQVGFAFGRIESALTVLVANLSELSGLAAKTERIDALFTGGFCHPVPATLHVTNRVVCNTVCNAGCAMPMCSRLYAG